MQKLAVNALGDTVVAHDDVLFGAGDSAEAAYFVQSGRLQPGHQIFQMGLSQNGSPSHHGCFKPKMVIHDLDDLGVYVTKRNPQIQFWGWGGHLMLC
jgi:hypothetical protein